MNDASFQIDPGLNVPYLDQWMGEWFIEPRRGQTLHRAISQLNIGVHLGDVEQRGNRNDSAPPPAPIDYEQPPRTRAAYAYRLIDGVAILEINGALMKHQASAMESTSTTMMRRSVRKALHDDAAKAVVFMIDSPGGTVAGIYELASDIAALAKIKPTFAHCSNICASAAYLLASQMRSISATQSTLMGSLGTYGVVYDTSRAYEDAGIKAYLLKGKINGKKPLMKGAGEEGIAISEEQLARMQESVDDFNQQFFEAVASGPRKPKRDSVESWFVDAGVWIAPKAKAMGLIDRVESFDAMFARISGKAPGGADTVPSESIEPTDDATETKRRSESREVVTGAKVVLSMTSGDNEIAFMGETVEEVMELRKQLDAETLSKVQQQSTVTAQASSQESPTAEAAGLVDDPQAEDAKESHMSDTKAAPAGGSAVAQESKQADPKPATIAELKAAFKTDPAFALDAAEKALTLVEAKAAYADVLQQRLEASQKEVTDLKASSTTSAAATTEAAVAPKAPGVKPSTSRAAEVSSGGGEAGEDAVAEYESRVAGLMQKNPGMTREKAAAKVLGDDAVLRDSFNAAKLAQRQDGIRQQVERGVALANRQ